MGSVNTLEGVELDFHVQEDDPEQTGATDLSVGNRRLTSNPGFKRRWRLEQRLMTKSKWDEVVSVINSKGGVGLNLRLDEFPSDIFDQQTIIGRAGDPIRVEAENANRIDGQAGLYAKVEFRGEWEVEFKESSSNNANLKSPNIGDYAVLTFSGQRVSVIGWANGDTWDIYIDDELVESEYVEPDSLEWTEIYNTGQLDPGEHTLRMVVSALAGDNVNIDAFDIYPNHTIEIRNDDIVPVHPKLHIESVEREYSFDYGGKVAGSTTENKAVTSPLVTSTEPDPNSSSWDESSQGVYNNMMLEDGKVAQAVSTTNGSFVMRKYSFPLTDIAGGVVEKIKSFAKSIKLRWVGESRGVNDGVRNWETILKIWNAAQEKWEDIATIGPAFSRASTAYLEDGTEVAANVPRFERGNWGMHFNGENNYIQIPHNEAIAMGEDSFAIEFRIKSEGNGNANLGAGIIDKLAYTGGGSTSHQGYELRFSSTGRLTMRLWNNNSSQDITSAGIAVNDEQWHDVTIIVNRSTSQIIFIIDGAVESGKTITQTGTLFNTKNLQIGRKLIGTTAYFRGWLDEIRLWRGEYSVEDALANRGKKTKKAPGLVARWGFDEGPNAENIAKDTAAGINLLSQNQYDGGEDETTSGWEHYGGNTTLTSSTTTAYQGSRSIRFTRSAVGGGRGFRTTPIPVVPGTTYSYTVHANRANTDTEGLFRIEWLDAEGSPISTGGNSQNVSIYDVDEWGPVSGTDTAPEGAAYARLDFQSTLYFVSLTMYVDAVAFHNGSVPVTPVPPKTDPFNGTIAGAMYSSDNAFGMPFGDSMLIEGGTSNILSPITASDWSTNQADITELDDSVIITSTEGESNNRRVYDTKIPTSETMTFSVWVRNVSVPVGGLTTVSLRQGDDLARCGFAWQSDGSLQHQSSSSGVQLVIVTHWLKNVGGGWWRIGVTVSGLDTETTCRFEIDIDRNNPEAGESLEIKFPQAEAKPYPTSWTLGGTTRANESLTAHAAGMLSLEESQIDIEMYYDDTLHCSIWNAFTGFRQNVIELYFETMSGNRHLSFRCWDNGVNLGRISHPIQDISPGWHRFTVTWVDGWVFLYIDGVKIGEGSVLFPDEVGSRLYLDGRYDWSPGNRARKLISGFRIRSGKGSSMSDAEIAAEFGKPMTRDAHTTYLQDFNGDLSGIYPYEATVTTSPTNYVDNDGTVHILARPRYPSDGADDSAVLTDYVRMDVVYNYLKNPKIVRKGNLLRNPGFEEGSGSHPDSWLVRAGYPSWERIVTYEGRRSIKVGGGDNSYHQEVSVRPGRYYLLSAWVRGEKGNEQVQLVTDWRDGNGDQISIHQPSFNLTTEFKQYHKIVKAPDAAVRCQVMAYCGNAAQTVYIDNIMFCPVESADSLVPDYTDEPCEEIQIGNNLNPVELTTGDVLSVDLKTRAITLWDASEEEEIELDDSYLTANSSFWSLIPNRRNTLELSDSDDSNHRFKLTTKVDHSVLVDVENVRGRRRAWGPIGNRETSGRDMDIVLVEQ